MFSDDKSPNTAPIVLKKPPETTKSPDGLDELFGNDQQLKENETNDDQNNTNSNENLFDDATESLNFKPDKTSQAKIIPKIIPKVLKRCPVNAKKQEEIEKELKLKREQERLDKEKSMAQKEQDYRKVREKYFGAEEQVSFDQEVPDSQRVEGPGQILGDSSEKIIGNEIVDNKTEEKTILPENHNNPTLDQAITTKPRQPQKPGNSYTTDKMNTYPFYKNQNSYNTINQQKKLQQQQQQQQQQNNLQFDGLTNDFATMNLLTQQQMLNQQQEELAQKQAQITQMITAQQQNRFRGNNLNANFKVVIWDFLGSKSLLVYVQISISEESIDRVNLLQSLQLLIHLLNQRHKMFLTIRPLSLHSRSQQIIVNTHQLIDEG